jgi:hypothetical protein
MTTRYPLSLIAVAAVLASAPVALAQTRPDGTPSNPPSTTTGRAVDRAQGETPRSDGTPGNPPGTAVGRAVDSAFGTNTNGPNPAGTVPGTTATSTGAAVTTVDAASLRGGLSASRLIDADVYGANDREIGEIEDIIIPLGGGAPVAVLSVGGFLGIGERHVAVPWGSPNYWQHSLVGVSDVWRAAPVTASQTDGSEP